jgi:hypothetical protein
MFSVSYMPGVYFAVVDVMKIGLHIILLGRSGTLRASVLAFDDEVTIHTIH